MLKQHHDLCPYLVPCSPGCGLFLAIVVELREFLRLQKGSGTIQEVRNAMGPIHLHQDAALSHKPPTAYPQPPLQGHTVFRGGATAPTPFALSQVPPTGPSAIGVGERHSATPRSSDRGSLFH